jgi:hypothetical protein
MQRPDARRDRGPLRVGVFGGVATTTGTDGTSGDGVDPRHLAEVILEVMSRPPGFVEAFTAASGGETRLADLDVTIAAALTAHALNIGYGR